VEAGLVRSLSRPGGNLTGITFLSLEVAGKRVEFLKQALPRLRTLAGLSNTDHPGEKSELRATETAAQALGINLIYVPFSQSPFGASPELGKALETIRRAQPDAMVVFPEGATMANRRPCQLWYRAATAVDIRLERVCRRWWIDELRRESA
jgi:putative ABC transport system substrate-binding protein